MDDRTKQYIEDVLKALGQMAHERNTPGKMALDVELRQELITRGADLIGLFPVGNWKPAAV